MSTTKFTHQTRHREQWLVYTKRAKSEKSAYTHPSYPPGHTHAHTIRHKDLHAGTEATKKEEREGAHHDALKTDERQEASVIDVA